MTRKKPPKRVYVLERLGVPMTVHVERGRADDLVRIFENSFLRVVEYVRVDEPKPKARKGLVK